MNKKKTEALTFPSNPLAAMRELQDLDPAPSINSGEEEESPLSGTESEATETSSKSYRQIEVSIPRTADPVRQAIVQVLSQPFQGDPLKGPFTVTTVKVPTAIWERLALYAQLTGEHKQEILAKALRDFLKPGRAKGGV